MATAPPKIPRDAPTDLLPDDLPDVPEGWERADDRAELQYGERAAWVHQETGHRVNVKQQRKPTQMNTPETSTDDTGFVAFVWDEEYGGQLTYDLASKVQAYEAAVRFMATYPAGGYEVPDPSQNHWASRKLEWEL